MTSPGVRHEQTSVVGREGIYQLITILLYNSQVGGRDLWRPLPALFAPRAHSSRTSIGTFVIPPPPPQLIQHERGIYHVLSVLFIVYSFFSISSFLSLSLTHALQPPHPSSLILTHPHISSPTLTHPYPTYVILTHPHPFSPILTYPHLPHPSSPILAHSDPSSSSSALLIHLHPSLVFAYALLISCLCYYC